MMGKGLLITQAVTRITYESLPYRTAINTPRNPDTISAHCLFSRSKMKPLPFQTPKPSSTRSRSKETPQAKRRETGSSDPKILSKSSAADLSELTETDASDSSSSKSNQPKIVPKSLNFEFESVSEDLAASASDPPLFPPDLESSFVDQDLTSWISPQPAISSEVVQGGGGSGKIVLPVENPEAVAVTDLLKESILEFKSSAKVLDALWADLGGGERKSATGWWSDGIFWMKMQAGLSLFLIVAVAVSNFMVASGISVRGGEGEWSFTGLYPT